MVSISTPNIYKVYAIIHMLYMDRWIHQHATAIILVGPDFRKLAKFLGHSWATTTNDVMVHWLRPQIHME
jgi:hypothetical protein